MRSKSGISANSEVKALNSSGSYSRSVTASCRCSIIFTSHSGLTTQRFNMRLPNAVEQPSLRNVNNDPSSLCLLPT